MEIEFRRPHHQAIALILSALDGKLLTDNKCLFGGGTAITLLHGEYRESVDMDFLVSEIACYRQLRQKVRENGINALSRFPIQQAGDIRADQYGIRTKVAAGNSTIKVEIVFEGRIQLDLPRKENTICGISVLSKTDCLASKLLANSDRWQDDGVFSRDLIDLAMMTPTKKELSPAMDKATAAYGSAVQSDLVAAIDNIFKREHWLERCITAMDITTPKAVLWENIKRLRSRVD